MYPWLYPKLNLELGPLDVRGTWRNSVDIRLYLWFGVGKEDFDCIVDGDITDRALEIDVRDGVADDRDCDVDDTDNEDFVDDTDIDDVGDAMDFEYDITFIETGLVCPRLNCS